MKKSWLQDFKSLQEKRASSPKPVAQFITEMDILPKRHFFSDAIAQLTNNPAEDDHPVWTPDDNYIYFYRNRS